MIFVDVLALSSAIVTVVKVVAVDDLIRDFFLSSVCRGGPQFPGLCYFLLLWILLLFPSYCSSGHFCCSNGGRFLRGGKCKMAQLLACPA